MQASASVCVSSTLREEGRHSNASTVTKDAQLGLRGKGLGNDVTVCDPGPKGLKIFSLSKPHVATNPQALQGTMKSVAGSKTTKGCKFGVRVSKAFLPKNLQKKPRRSSASPSCDPKPQNLPGLQSTLE
jgi:hypothetical protein